MRVSATLHPRIHLSLQPHSGAEGPGLEEQGLMGNHPTLDPHAPQPNMQSLANSAQCKQPGSRQPAETPGRSHAAWGTRTDLDPWACQMSAHASHEEGQAGAGAATQTLAGKPLTFLPTLWHPAPWHLCPTLRWPLEAYDAHPSHCSNSNSSSSSRLSMQSREVPGLGKVPGKTRTCLSGCGGDTVWEALRAPKLGPTALSLQVMRGLGVSHLPPEPWRGTLHLVTADTPAAHSSRPLF